MDAIRELFYKPVVLFVGSGEEYGHIRESEVPITEENRLGPEISTRQQKSAKICLPVFMHRHIT